MTGKREPKRQSRRHFLKNARYSPREYATLKQNQTPGSSEAATRARLCQYSILSSEPALERNRLQHALGREDQHSRGEKPACRFLTTAEGGDQRQGDAKGSGYSGQAERSNPYDPLYSGGQRDRPRFSGSDASGASNSSDRGDDSGSRKSRTYREVAPQARQALATTHANGRHLLQKSELSSDRSIAEIVLRTPIRFDPRAACWLQGSD